MRTRYRTQKVIYILTCIFISAFIFGCKQKGSKITVFDRLPDSIYLTQVKTAIENKNPVAVAFTAEWCPHCRAYKPIFFEVKELYKDKVTFINIDLEDTTGSTLSSRFQVRGIPTTAFVRADGSVLKVQVGEIGKDELIKIADELIVNKKKKRGEPIAPFPIEPVKEEKVNEPAEEKNEKPQDVIKEESSEPSPEQDIENPAPAEEGENESPDEKNDEPGAEIDMNMDLPQEETK